MAQVQWERGCGVAANASRIDTAETGAGHAPWSSNGRQRVVNVVAATPRRVACAGPLLSWKSADAGAWALFLTTFWSSCRLQTKRIKRK